MFSLLKKMVCTPSVTFEESAVAAVVSEQLAAWGIAARREGNNILALTSQYKEERKNLLLCAHLDTVPPAKGYTRDPYDPGKDEDRIWGLGSNDDGGSVVALIETFRRLQNEDLPINLMMALTCEEERSGEHGIHHLWDNVFGKTFPRPDFAIVGEPTGGRAAIAERGLLVIDAEARGISGHAARKEGVSALYHAIEDINTLREYQFEKISPFLGAVKLSVTQINAGTAHNVIPDRCQYVIDIRPTEQYTNAEILAILQHLLHDENREAQGLQTTLTARNLKNRSSATHPDSPLLKALQACSIETFASPTTSDWMHMQCDTIKMGPGESSRSHRPNEYILKAEIEEAVDKYLNFIRFIGQGHCL